MSTSTRTIDLYVVKRSSHSRSKELWLDLEDLEWAVRFMYMQFACSGLLCTVIRQERKVDDP